MRSSRWRHSPRLEVALWGQIDHTAGTNPVEFGRSRLAFVTFRSGMFVCDETGIAPVRASERFRRQPSDVRDRTMAVKTLRAA